MNFEGIYISDARINGVSRWPFDTDGVNGKSAKRPRVVLYARRTNVRMLLQKSAGGGTQKVEQDKCSRTDSHTVHRSGQRAGVKPKSAM